MFFEYVDFTGFQRFKIVLPQKLSTGFVDYSQLIHTQTFSEKITFSKTPFRFAYCIFLQISILFCNYYYYKDATELMNIRISGASEQNGDAAREVNRACNVKNMFERNARERL